MFGYSKEEILGHLRVEDTMAEKDWAVSKRNIDEIFKGNTTVGERTFLRKDGTQFIGEFHSGPIYKGEDVVGVRGVLRDITASRQAEILLRESELKFRSLFDLSPQAIAVTEVETGRLIDVNYTFCELTKYSKEEILGRTTTELGLYSKEGRDRFIDGLHPSGEIHGLEMDFKAKDGSILNSLMFARLIQLKDQTFILAVFFDITDKKRLEFQLLQAQKMEALFTLSCGFAHDFNNLLMGIMGNTSLIIFETDPKNVHYERLRNIEKLVQSGSQLTRQLLGYARKGGYGVKPVSLNQLVEETAETFGRTKKEITIHCHLAENLSPIKADKGQIEQVLLNLYVNAADAMPSGGDLIIETVNVTHRQITDKLYKPNPGRYAMLTVTDTGTGMDKATIERIFDPFFTTKEMGRGTGLGMASAYGIVKGHGGYIDVDSQRGQGTTFRIYLPASEGRVIEKKVVSGKIVEGKETILLVDDEEMVLEVGTQVLNTLGYTVLEAKGGKEAVDVYQSNRDKIHIVLLDMIMPQMGGGETYDRIKEINPKVKVLLSSGYSVDGQAKEILERGCDGFIQKPFNMKQISQKIREILDKK